MSEKQSLNSTETSPYHTLPTVIRVNPREKIEPVEIPVMALIIAHKEKADIKAPLVWEPELAPPPPKPIPYRSLTLSWSPKTLCFGLYKEKVVQTITVMNSNTHCIYVQCCGLWSDTARLGASWRSYPRGRFLLAPGMETRITVSAKPREWLSPIPLAFVGLQLAAAHKRDMVTGYFVVPIQVNFSHFINPPGEGELKVCTYI